MGLPRFYTRLLKNWVSLKRIEDYLLEEEVPAFVSSLKASAGKTASAADSDVEGKIGFINASFKWNAGNKEKDKDKKDKDKKDKDKKKVGDAAETVALLDEPVVDTRVFELNDV